MDNNTRIIETDKDGYVVNGRGRYKFRPFWDLHFYEQLIKEEKLESGVIRYHIKTNAIKAD